MEKQRVTSTGWSSQRLRKPCLLVGGIYKLRKPAQQVSRGPVRPQEIRLRRHKYWRWALSRKRVFLGLSGVAAEAVLTAGVCKYYRIAYVGRTAGKYDGWLRDANC